MVRRKTFAAANITILCDERCPLYYCSDPCRVERHVKVYSDMLRRGYRCPAL